MRARLCLGSMLSAVFAVLFAIAPPPAAAQDKAAGDDGPLLITLGAYGVFGPKFEGSKGHDISPWPIISWRNANDKEWLDLPKDGLEYTVYETDNFRFGASGYVRWQRDTSTIVQRGFQHLKHSSIDLSLEAGAFAEYWPMQWLRTRIEAREAVYGATGLVGYLSSDAVWRPDSKWTFAAGPRLSVADNRFMTDYYGVNQAQSNTSGLPVYATSAGLRSYGAGTFAKYKISTNWTTQGFFEYEHLSGTAGDSPVISQRGSREQYMIGLGLSYTFKAPWEK